MRKLQILFLYSNGPKLKLLKRIHFILLLLVFMPFQSCEEEGICTGIEVARMQAGFYVREGDEVRDTTIAQFIFFSPTRPDSLLYPLSARRNITFPLSNEQESHDRFVFQVADRIDTLHIYKESSLALVSYACGFTTHHYVQGAGSENIVIDTIVINDPLVNLESIENLKIYIKPAAADTAR
jgi:hypothetical protein